MVLPTVARGARRGWHYTYRAERVGANMPLGPSCWLAQPAVRLPVTSPTLPGSPESGQHSGRF